MNHAKVNASIFLRHLVRLDATELLLGVNRADAQRSAATPFQTLLLGPRAPAFLSAQAGDVVVATHRAELSPYIQAVGDSLARAHRITPECTRFNSHRSVIVAWLALYCGAKPEGRVHGGTESLFAIRRDGTLLGPALRWSTDAQIEVPTVSRP